LCVFLFEQIEFRHAGPDNDLSKSYQANAFRISKNTGFREHACPPKPVSEKSLRRLPIDHIACSKINLVGL
jgi:hypothetical protein